ncbi:metal-sulfur cluster assembly factor [Roseateles paludis]|jgi:metal-sulfur cluster biosynthetic enzyme|uniref:Metal-sulfur cluster assembly factor n=1 Tax=Roseateles paludis TaxID=3145238 RepID=A0ABV0FZB8_9BURK
MADETLIQQAWDCLREVLDPELGVNVVDLGLVEFIQETAQGLLVRMTLTSAACPMADMLLDDVEDRLNALLTPPRETMLELSFNPPWTPERMSAAGREQLGWQAGPP